MSRYVDVDELHSQGWVAARYKNWEPTPLNDNFRLEVEVKSFTTFPAADVVSRGVLEQVMWERDLAISQLAEIGKGLGEKMDDVQEVRHGRWVDDETAYICSVCFHGSPNGAKWHYCPNCGAEMSSTEVKGE